MKKKIVLVAIVGVVIATLTLGKALGAFRDVSRSEDNVISSGEFDIRISRDNSRFYDNTRIFKLEDLKPGDTKNVTFFIKNYGEIPASNISMYIFVKDVEDKLSSAEKPYDLTPDKGELSSCIIVNKILVNSKNILDSPKKLSELAGKEIKLFTGGLAKKESIKVTLLLSFDSNAGNECMTDSTEVMLKIVATQ
ncbi:methyltransferase [Thermococcus chitonophagus]|uniref:Methyltransferase n=1 Tax=Thermococcus chitonophagus TaxID=54262 RepID=A0A160VS92_9EURY|nr:TasA family protein [Thermococcus chitonophagus]ASJ17312.1 methyltransferase [Thermococcus chitonophagus]CUX77943.1 hypothetical protein CHITON_1164 [Thermococcus chitonophagus]